MQITSEQFHQIAQKNGEISAETDGFDYGERFESVVGQMVLLRVGLYTRHGEDPIWLFEAANLSDSFYVESDCEVPSRNYVGSAFFSDFDSAMSALCDMVRLISAEPDFGSI